MVDSASGFTATGSNDCRFAISSLKGVAPREQRSPNMMARQAGDAGRQRRPRPCRSCRSMRFAPQSLVTYATSAGVSMTLTGLTTAPVFSAP